MTDSYVSPDVHWYAQSPQALPSSFGEDLLEDEARIQQYRDGGLHMEAERQVELVARRKELAAHRALAQHYAPMGDFEELLRHHFSERVEPGEYQGIGDEIVPAEVLRRLAELNTQKLGLLEESLLAAHADESVFDKIKFWVAADGEVLVVGTKKFGECKQKYLLAQWRPDGSPYTAPEVLRNQQLAAEQQVEVRKAIKRRQRVIFGLVQFVALVAYLAFAIALLVRGQFLWVCITVLWYMGLSSLITSARDRRIKSLTQ